MLGDVEMQDPAAIVSDDKEAVEDAEGDRGHGEKIHGRNRPLRWTNLNMLAHYARGFKSDKLEAQGAVLDKLVKSGVKSGVGHD